MRPWFVSITRLPLGATAEAAAADYRPVLRRIFFEASHCLLESQSSIFHKISWCAYPGHPTVSSMLSSLASCYSSKSLLNLFGKFSLRPSSASELKPAAAFPATKLQRVADGLTPVRMTPLRYFLSTGGGHMSSRRFPLWLKKEAVRQVVDQGISAAARTRTNHKVDAFVRSRPPSTRVAPRPVSCPRPYPR